MGSTVKCRLCGKKIVYESSQIEALGKHLFETHPENSVTHFTFDNGNECWYGNLKNKNPQMFKTTVETWKPGTSILKCSACGKMGPPIIRKRRNKVTDSSLGALCLIGCWPLCFLPFILGGSNDMHLYCKHCSSFLGTYDRKTGQLQPCDATLAKSKVPLFSGCG